MGRRKPKGASTELPKLDELKLDGLLVPPSAQPKVTQEMVDGICNILWHNHQTWPITSAVVEVSRYLYTTGGRGAFRLLEECSRNGTKNSGLIEKKN